MSVFVKVSCGNETRKMQVGGSITYDELKQKVASLFPRFQDGKTEFGLQYLDTVDGDLVTISSDAEVATALAHLPADSVWRVQIVPARRTTQRARARSGALAPAGGIRVPFSFGSLGPSFGSGYGDSLFDEMQTDPFWSPFGLFSVGDRERRTREWEDMMRQREQQFDEQIDRMRQMQEHHLQQFEEQRKKAEESMAKQIQGKRTPAQKQVKQPTSAEGSAITTSGGGDEVTKGGSAPGWHCQTFGTWEPVQYESPYGHRTVIGPVGYHMYWGYSDPESMETQTESSGSAQEQKKEEEEMQTSSGEAKP